MTAKARKMLATPPAGTAIQAVETEQNWSAAVADLPQAIHPNTITAASIEQEAANLIEFNETRGLATSALRITEPVSPLSGFSVGYAQNDFSQNQGSQGIGANARQELQGALIAAGFSAAAATAAASDVTGAGTGTRYFTIGQQVSNQASDLAADQTLNSMLSHDPTLSGSPALQSISGINGVLQYNANASASITQYSNTFLSNQWTVLNSGFFTSVGGALWAPVASALQGSTAVSIAIQILVADYNNQYNAAVGGPLWNLFHNGSGAFGPTGSTQTFSIPQGASAQGVLTILGQAMLSTQQAGLGEGWFGRQEARIMRALNAANNLAAANGLAALPSITFSARYGTATFIPGSNSTSYSGSTAAEYGGTATINGIMSSLGDRETINAAAPGSTSTSTLITPIAPVTITQTSYYQPNELGAISAILVQASASYSGPITPIPGVTIIVPDNTNDNYLGSHDVMVLNSGDTATDQGVGDQYDLVGSFDSVNASNVTVTESYGGYTLASGVAVVTGNGDLVDQGLGSWLDVSGTSATVNSLGGSGDLAIDLLAASTSATIDSPANLFFSANQQTYAATDAQAWMFANGAPLTNGTEDLNGNGNFAYVEPTDTAAFTGSNNVSYGTGSSGTIFDGNTVALDSDTGELTGNAYAMYNNTQLGSSEDFQYWAGASNYEYVTETSGLNGTGSLLFGDFFYADGDQQEYDAYASDSSGLDGLSGWSFDDFDDWFNWLDDDGYAPKGMQAQTTGNPGVIQLGSQSYTAAKGTATYNVQIAYSYTGNTLSAETQTVSSTAGVVLGTSVFNALGQVVSTTGTSFGLTIPAAAVVPIYGSGSHANTASAGITTQVAAVSGSGSTAVLTLADTHVDQAPTTLAGILSMGQTAVTTVASIPVSYASALSAAQAASAANAGAGGGSVTSAATGSYAPAAIPTDLHQLFTSALAETRSEAFGSVPAATYGERPYTEHSAAWVAADRWAPTVLASHPLGWHLA